MGKYSESNERVKLLLNDLRDINNTEITSVSQISRIIKEEFGYNASLEAIRAYVKSIKNEFEVDDKPNVLKEISDQIGVSKDKLGLTWIKGK